MNVYSKMMFRLLPIMNFDLTNNGNNDLTFYLLYTSIIEFLKYN